jgi:hypothetical protein
MVQAVFALPDSKLDYTRAKIAFDRIVDLSINAEEIEAQVNRLAQAAVKMVGPDANEDRKLGALHRVIYTAGPWNDNRPFSYDMADPLGQNIRNKLLSTYLRTRRGNCVSMPILFIAVGEKMGLKGGALATAPQHMFVKYTKLSGQSANLETTSGANPTRDEQYHREFPMTDRAIESGIYMRALPRREGMVAIGAVVLEELMARGQTLEVIRVANLLLAINPRDVVVLLMRGTANGLMIENEMSRMRHPSDDPSNLRLTLQSWADANRRDFAQAEALGWRPEPEPVEAARRSEAPAR